MNFQRIIITTVLVLGLGRASQAGTLASSTLRAKTHTFFVCSVTNIGKKPREVTAEIIRGDNGGLLQSTGPSSVDPSHRIQASYDQSTYSVLDGWCRVTVKGGKNSVRGTFSISHAADDTIAAVELR